MLIVFFGLLFASAVISASDRDIGSFPFSCMDQSNRPVDWFAAYKLPHLKTSPHPHVANGTGFLYTDVNNKQWQLSSVGLELSNQALAYTLQQFYDRANDPTVFHLMYNDEHPLDGPWSETLGHTKGVLFFNQLQGIWLVHSVPKFPQNTSYAWPSNAYYYGQSMLCITFSYSQLGDIATQLYYNTPFIYSSALPTSIAQAIPTLAQVIAGRYQSTAPYNRQVTLKSLGGQSFVSFAKAGGFQRDLYYDFVAPSLLASFNTETWQHGGGNLMSWCYTTHPYQVHNIESISLPFGINFSNYDDHSKFAVSSWTQNEVPNPWVCIGDINRQQHQMFRGGGTVCIQDRQIWTIYNSAVAATWPCTGSPSDDVEESNSVW
uniref:Deoxyribonuclease II n=1 Tax=Plectus sambesii TaxID=2011161 RepID=A0A914XN94_9BILA